MNWEECTLLSNGPNVAKATPDRMRGPVVACNHAVGHGKIRAHVWCYQEHPRKDQALIAEAKLAPEEGYQVWIGQPHSRIWGKLARRRLEHGKHPLKIVYNPRMMAEYNDTFLWQTTVWWTGRTPFTALGNMVQRGAKKIHVYGMDLYGIKKFGGGKSRTTTDEAHRRWNWEGIEMNKIIDECAEHGVEVLRWVHGDQGWVVARPNPKIYSIQW